ncbi:focadhesin isoform X2 [Tachypleus tridentatus]|uniref:focadhesin isoform X2 n=1 Tax=Tachypleus tridentatus TaxID=6853 RepID=UPI003FD3B399
MEEFKVKLEFQNMTTQKLAVTKLLSQLIAKVPQNKVLSISTSQVPELQFLFDRCGDLSPSVSVMISQGIATLVMNDFADASYIIDGFLVVVPSARYLNGIITAIAEIMQHQMRKEMEKIGEFRCIYSLRSSPHPFVTILQERKDSWPLIREKLGWMLKSIRNNESRETLELMKPLLMFLMMNPNFVSEYNLLRNETVNLMLQQNISSPEDGANQYLSFILSCLPWIQVRTKFEVTEVILMMEKVLKTYLIMSQEDRIKYNVVLAILISLALVKKGLEHGLEPWSLLVDIETLCCQLSKETGILEREIAITVLSLLFLKMPSDHLKILLNIGSVLIDHPEVSPTVSAMLIAPLIELILTPPISQDIALKSIAVELVEKLESMKLSKEGYEIKELSVMLTSLTSDKQSGNEKKFESVQNLLTLTSFVSKETLFTLLAKRMDKFQSYTEGVQWAEDVSKLYVKNDKVKEPLVFLLLIAMFYRQNTNSGVNQCLEVLRTLVRKHPEQGPILLPVLLYKLNIDYNPDVQFAVIETVPQLATHKLSVPPVLNVIKLLHSNTNLRPFAIRCSTLLWKEQPRCFPFLQKFITGAISKQISSDTNVDEVLLARVTAIKEVCEISPSQHGAELLSTLSSILNQCTEENMGPIAALALQGITALCTAEVIDLRTTWRVLAPRLTKDKRPIVTKNLFAFLSLVPQVGVPTVDYEKFMSDIVSLLWRHISLENNPVTIGAAYKTLAAFPANLHFLKVLPDQAKQNLKLPPSFGATPFEMAKLPEDILSYTPGYCFTDLLKSIDDEEVLKGYECFLASLVRQEINDLPRSIYHQAKISSRSTRRNKALDGIPGLLCNFYEANKLPAIQGSSAVGVLLSYEPPLEVGKDGAPLKHSLVCQGRFYEQVLGALIQDVPLDVSEWRRCMIIPNGWTSFLERAFTTMEQGRRIELELQKARGRLDWSDQSFSVKLQNSWLWVRDRIIETIRNASKGKPSSQANSVLAVGGLIAAVIKFVGSMDDQSVASQDSTDYVVHKHWVSAAIETILCALDPYRKHSKNVFSWLLGHASKPSSPSSTLIRGCSAMAVTFFVPELASSGMDQLCILFNYLTSQFSSSSSPTLEFYLAVGLGTIIQKLCCEGYVDENGTEITNLILNNARRLESCCYGENDSDMRIGPLLGLVAAVCGLSKTKNSECHSFVDYIRSWLYERLKQEDSITLIYEVLCLSVSWVFMASAAANFVSLSDVEELFRWFEDKWQGAHQCGGTAVSMGLLVDTLQRLGHNDAPHLRESLLKLWLRILISEGQPTLSRIAAMKGLGALYSSGGGVFQIDSGSPVGDPIVGLTELLTTLAQFLKTSHDIGLLNSCSWIVGEIFNVQAGKNQSSSSVPSDYSYLPAKSVLRPLVGLLSEWHKPVNAINISQPHVFTSLRVLNQEFSRPLPPINWSSVLTPFLRMKNVSSATLDSLEICLHQSKTSSNASSLLASWMVPPLVTSLSNDSQTMLMSCLPLLIKSLPVPKLELFLKHMVEEAAILPEKMNEKGAAALKGLCEAMLVNDPPQGVTRTLHNTLSNIVVGINSHFVQFEDARLLPLLSECLCQLPDETLDNILEPVKNDCNDFESIYPMTAIQCELIINNKRPPSCLNTCVDASEGLIESEQKRIIQCILKTTSKARSTEYKQSFEPASCLKWFLELLFKIKMYLEGKVKSCLVPLSEIIDFRFQLFAVAAIGWVRPDISITMWPEGNMNNSLIFTALPTALSLLMAEEPWSQVIEKLSVKYFIAGVRATAICETKL